MRQLRDERELSNDELAEATGLSIARIGQLLGGTYTPAAATLQSLADDPGVSLTMLSAAVDDDVTAPPDDDPDDEADLEDGEGAEEEREPEPALVEASAQDSPEGKGDDVETEQEAINRQVLALLTDQELPKGIKPDSLPAMRLLEALEIV